MKSAAELRRRAERYRRLATQFTDRRTVAAIQELAAAYDATADTSEKAEMIRRRAYKMWEEQGWPHGLHEQHWHDAERELAEEDD